MTQMKLIVDGSEIEVPNSFTLIQACEAAGAEIPRFCFHERLSVAGNCRMCLVEVVGEPKPVASCARSIRDLRPGKDGAPPVINTNTQYVRKAREGVMEFLLINHPLDCPICDQGGECDLQDQAMAYGVDTSRYSENKRAVEDKDFGPLVKTEMTRCIQCTRCVRFITEVTGVEDLGATGRGEDMEITTYLDKAIGSELQGNIIDLCPVGALTSKPHAFQARAWEYQKTQSIDVMDAVGSNIRVDTRGNEVMRILPRLNEAVNEEWISDKSRYVWDGLKTQRIDTPYIREKGKLKPATWAEAFAAVKKLVKNVEPQKIAGLAGDLASVEDLFAFKGLLDNLQVKNYDCRQDGSALHPAFGRATYVFNAGLAGVEEADAILLIGTNPRLEAPILNARIRKSWLRSDVRIASIGAVADLTYPVEHLGVGTKTLGEVVSGKNAFFDVLKAAKKPLIIVGQGALSRVDGEAVASLAANLAIAVGAIAPADAQNWNGFAVLHTAASRVGALDLGFVPAKGALDTKGILAGNMDVIFNLGADELEIPAGAKVIYIGTHGDRGAHRADIILPAATYTEKSGTYVNTEGRVQYANRANFPVGDAREDWAIFRAISEVLGITLPYNNFAQLQAKLYAEHPHVLRVGGLEPANPIDIAKLAKLGGKLENSAFVTAVQDFYLTNPIARASKTMAQCSQLAHSSTAIAAE